LRNVRKKGVTPKARAKFIKVNWAVAFCGEGLIGFVMFDLVIDYFGENRRINGLNE